MMTIDAAIYERMRTVIEAARPFAHIGTLDGLGRITMMDVARLLIALEAHDGGGA